MQIAKQRKFELLAFGRGNKKLGKHIAHFSLPAGYSCPGACHCLAKADRTTGKLTEGPETTFRCFAASQECAFPNVRESRWENLSKLKKAKTAVNMGNLLIMSLLHIKENFIRIHVGGDFFSQEYFDAWIIAARRFPEKVFYAYTKSIPFWIARKDVIPNNLKLVASVGGRYDNLIKMYGLRSAMVVLSEDEALQKGLKIDHDDSIAYGSSESFALLIHGTQRAGSEAGEALKLIRASH